MSFVGYIECEKKRRKNVFVNDIIGICCRAHNVGISLSKRTAYICRGKERTAKMKIFETTKYII